MRRCEFLYSFSERKITIGAEFHKGSVRIFIQSYTINDEIQCCELWRPCGLHLVDAWYDPITTFIERAADIPEEDVNDYVYDTDHADNPYLLLLLDAYKIFEQHSDEIMEGFEKVSNFEKDNKFESSSW